MLLVVRAVIVCPAPPGSRSGNRATALRWQRILRSLGHHVSIRVALTRRSRADVVIALHARRSAASVKLAKAFLPHVPVIVALTGTDLYHDLGRSQVAMACLEAADRVVVLHERGHEPLPRSLRSKVRIIVQSAPIVKRRRSEDPGLTQVVVVGHLRPEKDPMRTAMAVRGLPVGVAVRVLHIGKALDARFERAAIRENERNGRYHWCGEQRRRATRQNIADSDALVLSSRIEGGANVIAEAVQSDTAILASRIHSTVGLLGPDHPGLFPLADTRALREMLLRFHRDPSFRHRLRTCGRRLRGRFSPESERSLWRDLLLELG